MHIGKGTSILLAVLAISVSCKAPQSKSEAEDFEIFYRKFNADLRFQNSRMRYPVRGKYLGKENTNPSRDYEWTLKDSLDFDVTNLDTSIYRIRRAYSEGQVRESISIDGSSFYLEYTFALVNGEWFLINYSDLVGEN